MCCGSCVGVYNNLWYTPHIFFHLDYIHTVLLDTANRTDAGSVSLFQVIPQLDCARHSPEPNTGLSVKDHYPTLVREFQSFRVGGTFVFRPQELTHTPTNLANQVKVGHAVDQSRSVHSRGYERKHQNNVLSWRSWRTGRRLSKQFWKN